MQAAGYRESSVSTAPTANSKAGDSKQQGRRYKANSSTAVRRSVSVWQWHQYVGVRTNEQQDMGGRGYFPPGLEGVLVCHPAEGHQHVDTFPPFPRGRVGWCTVLTRKERKRARWGWRRTRGRARERAPPQDVRRTSHQLRRCPPLRSLLMPRLVLTGRARWGCSRCLRS